MQSCITLDKHSLNIHIQPTINSKPKNIRLYWLWFHYSGNLWTTSFEYPLFLCAKNWYSFSGYKSTKTKCLGNAGYGSVSKQVSFQQMILMWSPQWRVDTKYLERVPWKHKNWCPESHWIHPKYVAFGYNYHHLETH